MVSRAGRALAAAAVLSAVLALAACGSSDQVETNGTPTMLDTAKVESAITKGIFDQRGLEAKVACPVDVHQEKGLAFTCTASVPAGETKFVVTQLDGAGNVHYEARS